MKRPSSMHTDIYRGTSRFAFLLVFFLSGCGSKSQPESANLRYATDVLRARIQETRSAEITSIDAAIQGHRQCGLRLRAISDRDVTPELSNAVHGFADNCLVFADELTTWQRTPGADFAFVEGIAGLSLGAHPFDVGELAGSRMRNKNQAMARVETAHLQLEVAGADVWRETWSNLTPEESEILTVRMNEMLAGHQHGDTPSATAKSTDSLPRNETDSRPTEQPEKKPGVLGIVQSLQDKFGKVGGALLFLIGAGVLLAAWRSGWFK